MTHVFTLNSTDYVPVSFKDRYLFDTYDIITSYLKTKMSLDDLRRLLKPSLTQGGQIKWYGAFDTELARLSDLPQPIAEKIKGEFHKFLQKANSVSSPLLSSRDADSREWGTLISELFQAEKIILIGSKDGQWAMLWGWDFRNREENRLPVISFPREDDAKSGNEQKSTQSVFDSQSENTDQPTRKKEDDVEIDKTEKIQIVHEVVSKSPVHNIGCIGRIVRLLRWISYRFWALFWLIMYTLIVMLLTRHFSKTECDDCCKQLQKTREELEIIDQRIRDRCDSLNVRR